MSEFEILEEMLAMGNFAQAGVGQANVPDYTLWNRLAACVTREEYDCWRRVMFAVLNAGDAGCALEIEQLVARRVAH